MLKNNQFYLKDFSNIVFFGQPIPKIININKKLKIKSTVITSSDQSNFLKKNKIDYEIFNSVDQKCINFLKKKFNFKKTLFFGFSPRYIFKQKTISQTIAS